MFRVHCRGKYACSLEATKSPDTEIWYSVWKNKIFLIIPAQKLRCRYFVPDSFPAFICRESCEIVQKQRAGRNKVASRLSFLTPANLVHHLHTVPKPKNIQYIKSLLLAAICRVEIKSLEIQSALHHTPLLPKNASLWAMYLYVHILDSFFFFKSHKVTWRAVIRMSGSFPTKSVITSSFFFFLFSPWEQLLLSWPHKKQPSGKLSCICWRQHFVKYLPPLVMACTQGEDPEVI